MNNKYHPIVDCAECVTFSNNVRHRVNRTKYRYDFIIFYKIISILWNTLNTVPQGLNFATYCTTDTERSLVHLKLISVAQFEKLSILTHILFLPCDQFGFLIADCGPGLRKLKFQNLSYCNSLSLIAGVLSFGFCTLPHPLWQPSPPEAVFIPEAFIKHRSSLSTVVIERTILTDSMVLINLGGSDLRVHATCG